MEGKVVFYFSLHKFRIYPFLLFRGHPTSAPRRRPLPPNSPAAPSPRPLAAAASGRVREQPWSTVVEDSSASTFSVMEEDRTLANSVRFFLNQNRRVAFCGYSIPHPAENKVSIRVQTTGTLQ
ncbi:uncharacterized protein LOC133904487 [Phragmites australis]|uniref:uncharacterized protein LOC133904487 n=1 Tax=Phragmites australis TaxID=29695 RepID=UPI002D794B1C|nr:uncharacterized protein LOC133904487 [Phragmites australis]